MRLRWLTILPFLLNFDSVEFDMEKVAEAIDSERASRLRLILQIEEMSSVNILNSFGFMTRKVTLRVVCRLNGVYQMLILGRVFLTISLHVNLKNTHV